VKVGDIILRNDETVVGQKYKHARVVKFHEGMDGKARLADVEYNMPGESKFRMSTRPIHKLVVVIPGKEQTMEDGWEAAG
jgi:hypothetical protein